MSSVGTTFTSRLFFGSILSVAGITILTRVAGFGEKVAIAAFFGAGHEYDAYLVAFNAAMLVFFTVTGLVAPTIRPLLVRKHQEGAWVEASSQFFTWTVFFTVPALLCALAMFFFPEPIVRLLGPGFDEPTQALCANLLRWMSPCTVIFGALPLSVCALNARRWFVFSPLAELTMKVVSAGVIIVLARSLGAGSLSVALIAAAFAALLLHAGALRVLWPHPRWTLQFFSPEFRTLLALMAAPALAALVGQVGALVENAVCSNAGSGAVSALNFARKLTNLPILIIPVAYSTVLFTFLAELHTRRDKEGMTRLLGQGLRGMLYVFVPLAVLTALLAEPLVALVYERGRFDADSTRLVATVLLWLAPGMCFDALSMLLLQHFFSREDLWPPFLIGMGCGALKVILLLALAPYFGLPMIAVLIVATRAAKVLLLVGVVCRRAGIRVRELEFLELAKLFPSAVFAGAAGRLCVTMAPESFQTGTFSGRAGLVAGAVFISLTVYFGATYALGCSESRVLYTRLREYWA